MKRITQNCNHKLHKIAIGTSEGFVLLDYDSILYLQSDNNYTVFHLTDNKKIIATKNLGYFERKLAHGHFVRIHHSIVVNLNKVTRYVKAEGGSVVISNNKSLPVSRNKKASLLQLIKELC